VEYSLSPAQKGEKKKKGPGIIYGGKLGRHVFSFRNHFFFLLSSFVQSSSLFFIFR
jgi:hypothetical protein